MGTALATEASWIDWRHGVVRYPGAAMKARYSHTVDLNETAAACLRAALKVSPERPFPFSYWYLLKRRQAEQPRAGRYQHAGVEYVLDTRARRQSALGTRFGKVPAGWITRSRASSVPAMPSRFASRGPVVR